LFANETLECCDPGFVLLEKVGSLGVIVKGALLVFSDPDADQITGDIVPLRQPMQRFPADELHCDLTLELDAVTATLGHGFHSPKTRLPRSIPQSQSVHFKGRIPVIRAPTGLHTPCAARQSGRETGDKQCETVVSRQG
jgi:hypothetical protein